MGNIASNSSTKDFDLELDLDTNSTNALVTVETNAICRKSFQIIVGQGSVVRKMKRKSITTGVASFYTEFYQRLSRIPTNDFDSILVPSHQHGHVEVQRGAILMRIIRFVLSVQSPSTETINVLRALGKSHARRGIYSSQNIVFTNNLLHTIVHHLGRSCSHDIVQAWWTLLSFVIREMNAGCALYLEKRASNPVFVGAAPVVDVPEAIMT